MSITTTESALNTFFAAYDSPAPLTDSMKIRVPLVQPT